MITGLEASSGITKACDGYGSNFPVVESSSEAMQKIKSSCNTIDHCDNVVHDFTGFYSFVASWSFRR